MVGHMRRVLLRFLLLIGLAGSVWADGLRDGDLVFQDSRSSQSQAIQLATKSPYCHVGMILHRGREPWVIEAVQPVVETRLADWAKRGPGGAYAVRRLADATKVLDGAGADKLRREARRYLGRDYDWAFGWSDERIYCSELVWKIFERGVGVRLCEPAKLGSFDLSHPAVKLKLRERYGDRVPLDEPMVSPGQLYESPLLIAVQPPTR
jgi:hypothetical protein